MSAQRPWSVGILVFDAVEALDFAGPHEVFTTASRVAGRRTPDADTLFEVTCISRDGSRWIDNGALVTSAGISAGIDMCLHLVARLVGRELAERTARQMDYPWSADARS